MPVRDDADPHRHDDHAGDAHHPHRREALGENGGRAVEGTAPEHEHAEHRGEQDRFLEIEPFQERGEHAREQQPHRNVIGRLHAAEQRARQHQQPQAHQAPAEVRHLQHRERQELVQEREPLVDRRHGTGEQQQRPGEEGEGAGDLRHHRCDVQARQLLRPGERRALRRQLLGGEQQRAEQQRHQVVHAAVGEQRAEQRVRRHVRQGEQHHRLENAHPAGHVAHDAGDHRGGVHGEEGEKADGRGRRQQPPQHRRGQRQVHDRECDLRESERRSRGAQRPAADLERAAREGRPQRIGAHRSQQQRAHQQRPGVVQMQHPGGGRGREQQRQAADRGQPDSE